ncbi:epoxide hydrolase N-terminal domain-containing protein [Nonomuraea sp. NPDC049684]|uniref:epoxide hydrolase N-terminal domain-containing protein n=1 Tax=Nonomuraea sp. NPDC049684 TaxID=3364356 RepID=UPI0037974E79
MEIPQADLDDLQTRLDLTRFAEELPDEYGVSVKRVRRLAEYGRYLGAFEEARRSGRCHEVQSSSL